MITAIIFLLFALPFTNAQYGSNDASKTTSASSSTTASASSGTHKVEVGSGGITFNPDTLTVSPGEKVVFHFFPQNHSVVQASFDSPCQPMNTSGFSTGFVPTTTESETIFTLTINDTTPIWFYCGQFGHCQGGMVGVINPPSNGPETLDSFKKAASTAVGSTAPETVQGGLLGKSGGDASSSSSSVTTSSTAKPTNAGNSELNTYERSPLLAPSEYKAVHPAESAPTIRDGDLTLAESGACMEFTREYANAELSPDQTHHSYG
ncbi:hypothetical protein PENARI_c007G02652 [Penicillium arizonense]|uniref:Phytocyanin domain-containing protein n=1 Tax=Penicillium arizonense TaxID=1835702 RepID=A0A1F5LKF9_PENAI|nr:hypothetical protein PENARI_c007G02652 [Penicillium arizonense]OGE53586.1 hypothetical protein PENARI_c007G02652 [Penicillium arizonense]